MDFFSFYKEIKYLAFPFQTFQMVHFLMIGVILFLIYRLFAHYNQLSKQKQQAFQKYMGIYFFVEELLYTGWLLWRCKEKVWLEILPLQLCSICAIMAVLCVIFKRKELRFFCGVIGIFAGIVAVVYPANLSGLYPILSYRTLNFFVLHGAFILFGLIQLKEQGIAKYRNMKLCTLMLSIIVVSIFMVNMTLHTDYMFIGIPSSIGFINQIRQGTGVFFLPVVMLVFILIQFLVLYSYRYCMKKKDTNSMKINVTR